MSRDWVNLRWREMTWGEFGQAIVVWIVAWVVMLAAFGALCIFVLAPMIDQSDRRRAENDRCLKRATNGYEIKQCR